MAGTIFAAFGAAATLGPWGASKIRATLESEIAARLQAVGETWARIEIGGGTVRLVGAAPDQASLEQATKAIGGALAAAGVERAFEVSSEAVTLENYPLLASARIPAVAPARVAPPVAPTQNRGDSPASRPAISAPALKPAMASPTPSMQATNAAPSRAATRACQRAIDVIGTGRPIQFAENSVRLSPRERVLLRDMARALARCGPVHVVVEGHSDSIGREQANNAVSFERAKVVLATLAREGVGDARLHPIGRGDDRPIASNRSIAGRARNRRVELIVSRYAPNAD
jgi:outer membrane protein OmpA-like peptidoglycan-associated protein